MKYFPYYIHTESTDEELSGVWTGGKMETFAEQLSDCQVPIRDRNSPFLARENTANVYTHTHTHHTHNIAGGFC